MHPVLVALASWHNFDRGPHPLSHKVNFIALSLHQVPMKWLIAYSVFIILPSVSLAGCHLRWFKMLFWQFFLLDTFTSREKRIFFYPAISEIELHYYDDMKTWFISVYIFSWHWNLLCIMVLKLSQTITWSFTNIIHGVRFYCPLAIYFTSHLSLEYLINCLYLTNLKLWYKIQDIIVHVLLI